MSSAVPQPASHPDRQNSLRVDQTRRVNFLKDLVHLFPSQSPIDEILQQAAEKSAAVLGDSAFVVLKTDGRLRLEVAFSPHRERLVRMLIAAWNAASDGAASSALHQLIEGGDPVLIENIQQHPLGSEMQSVVEQCGLSSLVAAPIRLGDKCEGAYISISSTDAFTVEDLALAVATADFMAAAIERARLLVEVLRSAMKDSLTGVYNARFFHDTLSREAARAQRHGMGLSLLMVDIDGFKAVNDNSGHLVGDKILTHVANVISRTVRTTDVVCRCGGDEFGIVLPETTLEGAQRVAQKVVEKVQADQILQTIGYYGPVTVSIGVAEYQRGSHFETLVAEADQSLYMSKQRR